MSTTRLFCDARGHSWECVGSHEINDIPAYWCGNMAAVPRGSVTYDDYRCHYCPAKQSDERPYSWRGDYAPSRTPAGEGKT